MALDVHYGGRLEWKTEYRLRHVVVHHSVLRHLFILGSRTSVVGIWIDADATTRGKNAGDFDVFRIHQTDEVLHNLVDAILMEVSVVAETEEVELQAFALHHTLVGQVTDSDFGKVRLSRDRAEAREFGAVELYPVIVVGMFVNKCFQHLWGVILTIFGLAAQSQQAFLFTFFIHGFFVEDIIPIRGDAICMPDIHRIHRL